MSGAPVPPCLPVYEKPRMWLKAELPDEIIQRFSKPHGIMNKLTGKLLRKNMKAPKMKSMLNLMKLKKVPNPFGKPKKKKVL